MPVGPVPSGMEKPARDGSQNMVNSFLPRVGTRHHDGKEQYGMSGGCWPELLTETRTRRARMELGVRTSKESGRA